MNRPNRSIRWTVLTFSAFGLAACSADSTAPTSALSPRSAARDASASMPTLHSNSQKYREQTVPHQSNRSGSASLTTRALMAKDGSTLLEVTTGQLDVAGAPGNISKLQVKSMSTDKSVISTTNYNGLTGPVQTRTYQGLVRHNLIQTQANVRDIDPKRTDVVTVTERINLRPDLAVTDLDAPQTARPGAEIIVSANVRELNGDEGARDNCVLYVDGVEARRIDGQWVADGDAVTCAFRTSIASVGQHTLEVRSENVNPGDWDTANNTASRQITIVNPEVELHGWANAWQYEYARHYYNDYTWSNTSGYSGHSFRDYRNDRTENRAYIYGYANGQPGTGALTSVSMSITSGGQSFADVSATLPGNSECAYTSANNGYTWINVCSSNGYSYYNAGQYSGVAVYYDYYFDNTSYGYNYTYGPYASNTTWGNGANFAGDDVTFDIRAEGTSGTALVGHAVVQLGAWYDYDYYWYYWYNRPMSCSDSNDGYTQSHQCYEDLYHERSRSAGVNF